MAYNFLYFISGTVKFYTDDIFNKSVVSRITGISFHSNHVQTIEKFISSKVPESDWKDDSRVSRRNFYRLCTKLYPNL